MSDLVRATSAPVLEGRVFPMTVFVSDPSTPWDVHEKWRMLGLERQSEAWIMSQASRYRVPLAFLEGGVYGYDVDLHPTHMPSWGADGSTCRTWPDDIVRVFGWESGRHLLEHLLSQTRADAVHMTVFVNSGGRSFAMPAGLYDRKWYLGTSFVYHRWMDGSVQATPCMVAHEILHLYGAWDLYETGCVTREQADAATVWFPNDVMRWVGDIGRLEIGPLTAWRVGWASQAEPWYEWFRPGC